MYTLTMNAKKNGVPILSKEDINQIGEGLVADYCPEALRSPKEIDIDRFLFLHHKKQHFHLYLLYSCVH